MCPTALRLSCAVCSLRTTPPRARAVHRAALCRPHTHWHPMCATVTCSDACVCRVQRGGVCDSAIALHMNTSYRMGIYTQKKTAHKHSAPAPEGTPTLPGRNQPECEGYLSRTGVHARELLHRRTKLSGEETPLPDRSPRQRAAPPPHGAKRGGNNGPLSRMWDTHGDGAPPRPRAHGRVKTTRRPLQSRTGRKVSGAADLTDDVHTDTVAGAPPHPGALLLSHGVPKERKMMAFRVDVLK